LTLYKKIYTIEKQQVLLTQHNIFHVFLNLTKEKKIENITIEDICKKTRNFEESYDIEKRRYFKSLA